MISIANLHPEVLLSASVLLLLLLLAVYAFPKWHLQWAVTLTYSFFIRPNLPTARLEPNLLFAPIIRPMRCTPFALDAFGHKSNSTYFVDADISNMELLSRVTGQAFNIHRRRGELALPRLGGTGGMFLKEIKLGQRYVIKTRILAWDEKWVFLMARFELPEPNTTKTTTTAAEATATGIPEKTTGKERRIFAVIVSKWCYKHGRTTIPPQMVLEESALIPLPAEAGVKATSENGPAAIRIMGADGKVRETTKDHHLWSSDQIEEERKKGLKLAKSVLGLDAVAPENWDHYGRMTSIW